MDFVIILIALVVLFILCFKGVPTPIVGLVCSLVVIVAYKQNVYSSLTEVYMPGFVSFIQRWFLMFLFGSFLGKIMEATGAADNLANAIVNLVGEKRISLGIFLVSFIFAAAGISVYITIFIVLPLAAKMCKRADLPRLFILAPFVLGINVPLGMPYLAVANNILCTGYFNTKISAGGILGVALCVVWAILGLLWLKYYENRCRKKGLHFVPTEQELEMQAKTAELSGTAEDVKAPHWICCILPLLVPAVIINVFSSCPIEYALLLGAAAALILQFRHLPKKWTDIKAMITSCIGTTATTVINTGAIVGFGKIVTSSQGFQNATEAILSMQGSSPLLIVYICTVLLGAIAGSSTTGIILSSEISTKFLGVVSPNVLHQTVIWGSLGLDAMPNSGFLHTACAQSGQEIKDCYLPVWFMLADFMPLILGFVYIGLVSLFGMA